MPYRGGIWSMFVGNHYGIIHRYDLANDLRHPTSRDYKAGKFFVCYNTIVPSNTQNPKPEISPKSAPTPSSSPLPKKKKNATSHRKWNANALQQTRKLHRPLPHPPHHTPYSDKHDLILILSPQCIPPPSFASILPPPSLSQPRHLNRTFKPTLSRHLSRQIHKDGQIPLTYYGVGYHCSACEVQGLD